MRSHPPALGVPDPALVIDDLLRSRTLRLLLDRLPRLGLTDWWVAGPALSQTLRNVVEHRPADLRVTRFDILYLDAEDLRPQAEEAVAARAALVLRDVAGRTVLTNVARHHLRSREEYGVVTAPVRDVEDAVAGYATTASCLAVTHDGEGGLSLCAPFGVEDAYEGVSRPAPRPAPARSVGAA